MNLNKQTVAVIGGGAAGIFAALNVKETSPTLCVIVFEKSAVFLSKVRVSGGGRCNVTHACFDPHQLIKNYPRGGQELLGPFHRFQPKDMIAWLAKRGAELKTEDDGRMFPVTDRSQTIIDALLNEARRLQVDLRVRQHLTSIEPLSPGFRLHFRDGGLLEAQAVILATGSSLEGYRFAESLGHTIQPLAPSLLLLTFHLLDSVIYQGSPLNLPASPCLSYRCKKQGLC